MFPGTRYRTLFLMTAAVALSGCGVLPRVAQQTTAAAVAPVTTSARVVSQNLKAVSHNMAMSSAAAAQTARQTSRTAAQARAATKATQQRAKAAKEMAKRNATLKKQIEEKQEEAEASGADSKPFDILPEAVLAKLTTDQTELQRAAQKEAFTAQIGETIYWEDSGRTGTAMAEDESPMGAFVCRTFVQTLLIDAVEQRGTAVACKNPDGVWEATMTRAELAP